MLDIVRQLATELELNADRVRSALDLFAEGATVPFVARYRKERTGEMDEVQLRSLLERHAYLTELEARKQTVLEAIAAQHKLTPALQKKIESCLAKTELEDLYLPFRPKRRTRATMAKDKGLEPLAAWIEARNHPDAPGGDLEREAGKYVTKDVASVAEALQGAADIVAEAIAERADLRAWLRRKVLATGTFVSKMKKGHAEGSTQFEMYRDYRVSLRAIAPHNVLALLRGRDRDLLKLSLEFDEDASLNHLNRQIVRAKARSIQTFYEGAIADAFQRLMKPASVKAAIAEKKAWADAESIQTFAANARDLLLAAPAGMKPTLAIDPGFRTGCKTVALDATGKFLEYQTLFPHQSAARRDEAAKTLRKLVAQYDIELIAIGNGTASRETDAFVAEALKTSDRNPIKVMVNEAGASIYSASEVAIAEFPDRDVTVRGAISIGRRLQDPLAELVKIDPKSIGVGQYQHDVDQKLLKKKLDETVESCVNFVGVDLNTASKELLSYVAGITPKVAENIVAYRDATGAFRDRRTLLKIPKLGPKAYEQAAGFLRIREGDNPLDNTAVHPESYGVVKAIAKDLKLSVKAIANQSEHLRSLDLRRYVTDEIGEPTLRDIVQELEKPGRDPRAQFTYASFQEGIDTLDDLSIGMQLEGVITNVANFGAFVDVGVHQDGLVHISQMADRFVRDPKEIVKVGQVVRVRVLEIDTKLKRISLSMRSPQ
ncbi:MAG: Tex family protein [Cyanobacteria bacterium J06639_1]